MKEYKVLSQNDDYFSDDFAPEKLEDAMNEYAQKGWKVFRRPPFYIRGFGRYKRRMYRGYGT